MANARASLAGRMFPLRAKKTPAPRISHNHGIHDEHCVTVEPFLRERREQPDPVAVQEVQEDVREDADIGEPQQPAEMRSRGKCGPAQAPDRPHDRRARQRQQELRRNPVRNSSPEGDGRNIGREHQDVDVGQVGRDGGGRRRQGRALFESRLGDRHTDERMADVIHEPATVRCSRPARARTTSRSARCRAG